MNHKHNVRPESINPISIPQPVVEFILKPRGLPHPQGNVDAYLEQCEDTLFEMLMEALDPNTGILPTRTVMIQCLNKRPVPGEADFSLPVLIRAKNKVDACWLAASFSHVTHYLKTGKSSHATARDYGDCSRGNLVVFASKKPTIWLSSEFSNVIHVSLPVVGKRPVPKFQELFKPLENDLHHISDGIWRFEMQHFVDNASRQCWSAITKSIADGLQPEAQATPWPGSLQQDRTKAFRAKILAAC